jgi:hypothetical protein
MDRDWAQEFEGCSDNIELAWLTFKGLLQEGTEKYIPVNGPNSWKKKPDWKYPISKQVKTSIQKKHRLWTRFRETEDPTIEKAYKKARNIVRRESRKQIRLEQKLTAQSCKENPKKFWKFVNFKTTSRSTMGNIKQKNSLNGEVITITDDTEKAEAFVEFFSKVHPRATRYFQST